MLRVSVLVLAFASTTGCLHLTGDGYAHSHNAVKGPFLEIVYSEDEPALAMLVDGNCGLEVKRKGNTTTGMFTVGDDQAILWYFEPTRLNPKEGAIWLGQGKAQLPKDIGWKSRDAFEIQKGNTLLLRWNGSDYTVRQTTIDDKKLKAIAKEHRTGFAARDITLESEKTWKIAADETVLAEFLQKSRMTSAADGTLPDLRTLGKNSTVQAIHQQYMTKEGPKRRGEGFYHLVKAIESAADRGPVTQCEAISYLGAPQHVFEYSDRKPDGRTVMRQVYHYDLSGTLNGTIIHVECADGLFKSMAFLPAGKSD